jgi:predicted aspartyl protease
MPPFPLIEIGVVIGSESLVGEALPDTGYNGAVIIPIDVGHQLGAPSEEVRLTMADGFRVPVEAWVGELLIGNRTFEVSVRALGNEFIIGRQVLDQMEICFEFGRAVRIRFE